MAKVVKDCPRTDHEGVSYFSASDGGIFDTSDVNVIHSGLDTVRQLYSGLILPIVYQEIERVYSEGFDNAVQISDFEFLVSSGGRSGYRYILKNNNIGLVLLIGSMYLETKYNGHHLKIETSPVFLLSRSLHEIQDDLDMFANTLLSQTVGTGVAVHLCADVQGWLPPDDLDRRLTTKAHAVYKYSGTSQVEYDFNGVSLVYGKGETFTFGKAGSLQFSLYDKYKAVKSKGELPLWLPVWQQTESFDIDSPIRRFEARFHHTVIEQFANGSGFKVKKLIDLEHHLTGLWKYAMNNFRLDDSKTYINPLWQFIRDDIDFFHKKRLDIDYKRLYKAPGDDGKPSERSLAICFGQLCSIYGRNGYSKKKSINYLISSGIWSNLVEMYISRGKVVDDIYIDLDKKLSRFQKVGQE